ncbi:hypothetical protein BF96_02740 [Micrococcus luteus]|nr:hypothetical protein BF96_02740 [Micrococcus luteus]
MRARRTASFTSGRAGPSGRWPSRRSSSRVWNTAGVDSPASAGTRTRCSGVRAATGVSSAPVPSPTAAPPSTLKGTSAPSGAASSASSARVCPVSHRTLHASSAAAASAEPPPMPPATGTCLATSRWTPWVSGSSPRVRRRCAAARCARLRSSQGTSSVSTRLMWRPNGPTVILPSVRAIAVTVSRRLTARYTVATGW